MRCDAKIKEKAIALYKNGLSIDEAAAQAGCGKSSVHRWCASFIRKTDKDLIKEARALYMSGLSCKEIKENMSLTYCVGTIEDWCSDIIRKGGEARSGPHNGSWKGGVTPLNHKIRKSSAYMEWRKAVYERDGHSCVLCGTQGTGKNLNADHIKPFAYFPELRLDVDNGRTLCVPCHIKTPTYGWGGYYNHLKEV